VNPAYGCQTEINCVVGYKVYCACAVSRDRYIGGPPKPHVTIYDPELPIHCTTFTGLRWL